MILEFIVPCLRDSAAKSDMGHQFPAVTTSIALSIQGLIGPSDRAPSELDS